MAKLDAAAQAAQKSSSPSDGAAKSDREIAAGYTTAIAAAEKAELAAAELKRSLRDQAEAVAASGEDRRRAQDKALYDLNVERQRVLDGYAREDAERDARHRAREQAVRDAEDELLTLLRVSRDPEGKVPAVKVICAAYAQRVEETKNVGRAEGLAVAKKEYETAKKLDEAAASKDKALAEQEAKTLRERNAVLEAQNTQLLANQQKVVGDMKDVAQGALQASAGIQGKANDSLQSAATGARPGYPTRG